MPQFCPSSQPPVKASYLLPRQSPRGVEHSCLHVPARYDWSMPEVLRLHGYRFFFFSREGTEPHHIHVEQAERYAKFWLKPISLAESRGFRSSELRELHNLIEQHRDFFILAWDEHLSQ